MVSMWLYSFLSQSADISFGGRQAYCAHDLNNVNFKPVAVMNLAYMYVAAKDEVWPYDDSAIQNGVVI